MDILDLAGWQEIPARFSDRPFHEHNRLIKSVAFDAEERRALAREMADQLAAATGPTHFLLPRGGVEEWDCSGEAAHNPEGLAAFTQAAEQALDGRVSYQALGCGRSSAGRRMCGMTGRFGGKSVLVTGAGTGIGAATARRKSTNRP